MKIYDGDFFEIYTGFFRGFRIFDKRKQQKTIPNKRLTAHVGPIYFAVKRARSEKSAAHVAEQMLMNDFGCAVLEIDDFIDQPAFVVGGEFAAEEYLRRARLFVAENT